MPHAHTEVRREIRPLPALLVNQIAAGEVVERPASVVKELIDNAIDAGAGRIEVELELGGIELIRVTDDGSGIPLSELALAIAPHATSKIREAADLDMIGTLGFRGEALASIASVSRLTLRSHAAADSAGVIEAEGERMGPARPGAGPVGTSVTVRNLFFNTPARRKFLRSPPTEQGHCVEVVREAALSHPGVAFRVVVDGREVFELPPASSPRDRVLAALGQEIAEHVLEVQADGLDGADGLSLWGLAGLPLLAKATARAQHVFLNGRPIRDKTIQHAVKEAYRGLIEPGRHPLVVLMIEIDPGRVDVNVHPAKVEVRFRDQSRVHSAVLRAVRDALRDADLTPLVDRLPGRAAFSGEGAAPSYTPPLLDPETRTRVLVDFLRRPQGATASPRFDLGAVKTALDAPVEAAPGFSAGPADAPLPADRADDPARGEEPGGPRGPAPLLAPRPADRILQVHNSYVVTQDEEGIVIVDQHALHERVMFEALLARLEQGPLESQRLLAPIPVAASSDQMERLAAWKDFLDRLGVEVSPLGPGALGVHAFPSFLLERGVEPGPFMADMVERSGDFDAGREHALHEVLDMMACKAAVKAGDRLSELELEDLLKLRGEVERASSCPHGRPTSVRLSINQLEKLFHRS